MPTPSAPAPCEEALPLADVRVLEIDAGVRGGYATQVLGDLGAEVLRITSVADIDHDAPFAHGLHATLHRNKRWAVGGAEHEPEAWRRALAWAQIVFVEDLARHERLRGMLSVDQVLVQISDFGTTGARAHWRGNDLIAAAYGGGCQLNGEQGRAPLRPPPYVGDHLVGVGAALAALLAWSAVQRDGVGQTIDVSAVDAWATMQTAIGMLEYIFQGRVAVRAGRRYPGRAYPYTILRCEDGEIRAVCIQGREWGRALEMMGSPAWGREPRYADRDANQAHAAELDTLIEQWLGRLTKTELLELAIEHRVPWVPIRTLDDVMEDAQLDERGFLWDDGAHKLAGCPSRFSRTPARLRRAAPTRPEPLPEAVEGLAARVASAPPAAPSRRPPLDGLRVIDFGWAWAGGALGSLLADFGADVIKVESRRRLDPMRMDRALLGTEPRSEQGGLHHNVNRNKRSIAVDISRPEGSALVSRLVAESDVLIENLSTGTLDRCGLGADTLLERFPRLIYVSLSAVGDTGPLRSIRAYGPVTTALSGVDSLMGYPEEPVVGLQHAIADTNAALHGALAIVAAVLERRRSGRGQIINTSQMEAMAAVIGGHIAAHQIDGEPIDRPMGNRDPLMVPSGVFRTRGNDRWVAIACPDDQAWEALAQAMERPPWATDPALAHLEGRRAAIEEIERRIGEWTAELDAEDAAERVQAAGGYAAPLLDTGQRFADAHLQSRDDYVTVDHPIVGAEVLYGLPWKLSRTPGAVHAAAPLLGQHTREVLGEVLHMSDEEIDAIAETGVLA